MAGRLWNEVCTFQEMAVGQADTVPGIVVISRDGLLYMLHRLPAVANIMLTHE